ncbi:HNH endonuclease [Clostridium sp. ZBS15]|uniref:HNH endonuclease n=1 Tax=Clostridium sp. ZBS15 TaxID=2949969 RepID=UPI00207A20E1|nr:HNH endonuclease [Clostridium sp. ZBS15]
MNELLELFWSCKNKYFVDENKLNDYINSEEFMPSIFLDKKVYRSMRRSMVNSTGQYIRSSQVSVNALFLAEYMCEVDKNHKTFIRRKNGTNYTETHHLIPISRQNEFENSLDVEENVISLCSNCHNLLHYGKNFENVLKMLYEKRKDLLKNVGLEISYEKLLSYYI